ncbi:unnamed protein product [Gulo gulo]|uniref:Uncharacterized protein n=1 Tax=Gulo gulo TaxID=48420 RepID=A0A9X9LEZ8_GULGU|nr:unnamed protein product [Gulo gulo]
MLTQAQQQGHATAVGRDHWKSPTVLAMPHEQHRDRSDKWGHTVPLSPPPSQFPDEKLPAVLGVFKDNLF